MKRLPLDWQNALAPILETPEIHQLHTFIQTIYASEKTILPPAEDLFTAFRLTPLASTRVVILGQDPYPTPGHAHGLAFSILPPHSIAPSLRNIFKELINDIGSTQLIDTNLTPWAQQGVLLLNTILTVEAHASLSHAKKGWEFFTDSVIQTVSQHCPHVVFVLWGNKAQTKIPLIDDKKHLILTSAHPSPLSARHGFFGSKPFSKINHWLSTHGLSPIQW